MLYIILLLVLVSTALAWENIRASRSLAAQVLEVIPMQAVMSLVKPDQYNGLRDASWRKRMSLHWICRHFALSDSLAVYHPEASLELDAAV
jgi:hypothetical protein